MSKISPTNIHREIRYIFAAAAVDAVRTHWVHLTYYAENICQSPSLLRTFELAVAKRHPVCHTLFKVSNYILHHTIERCF